MHPAQTSGSRCKRVDDHGLCSGSYEPAAALPEKDPNPGPLLDHIGMWLQWACDTTCTLDINDGLGDEYDT